MRAKILNVPGPVSRQGVLKAEDRGGPAIHPMVCQPAATLLHCATVPCHPIFPPNTFQSEAPSHDMKLKGVCLLKAFTTAPAVH